jgi:hypothetical protein
MRVLYTLGLFYVALCGALLWRGRPAREASPLARPPHHAPAPTPAAGNGVEWFQRIKPFCNTVEVETQLKNQPPPGGAEGSGYAAACLALAGKIDKARERIVQLPGSERTTAVGIVFEVGHPVADAGDDKSAGPIMELVVEFWPNHYMALYHAGASEFILGQADLSRQHLESFLNYYHENDGWRSNALEMLQKLGAR